MTVAAESAGRGPSAHLAWLELACKDAARTPYPARWRSTRAVVLAQEFEAIRATVGPIRIGSAYRTPEHNQAIGGARHSQHCEGRALDLYPPTGLTMDEFYARIRARAGLPESALWGLGRYATFVHVDTRPRPAHGRLVVWRGSRAWAEEKA